MKKKILILIPLLLLTGCTINYNLEIDGDDLNETIAGSVTKEEYEVKDTDTSENLIYTLLNYDQNALYDEDSVYLRTQEDKGNKIDYNFSYKYNYNFDRSTIINNCFEYHMINETEDYYYIKLSGKFYCMYAKKIDIKVTSNNAVLENNARKVSGNTYTWTIKDSDNVDILLNVSKKVTNTENKKAKKINTFQIVGAVVLVVLCAVTFILYKKNNEK